MATMAEVLWVIAVMIAQGTSRLTGGRGITEHPIPVTLNDELNREDIYIENFEETNPGKVGDKDLFEADILLTDEQYEALRTRKALPYSRYRWSEDSEGYPYVPYVFQDSVDQDDVKAGIQHWVERTCIRFEETSNSDQPHLQFHIGSGCWSQLGMQSDQNGQQVSIGSGCNSLGTVAHEIGHALGFFHEQSRSDRDDYVKINTDNILSGKEGNFDQYTDNNFSVKYDYSSDMHYNGRSFTSNGGLTIATKDPLAQELIGSRTGLSHRDTILANNMYGCLDKWLLKCTLVSNPCQNEGFIGAECICICTVSTSGNNCETVNEEYYASLRNPKTEVITDEGSISVNIEVGEKFTKYIIASYCKTPKLTFQTFNLYRKSTRNGNTYCYFESLNIRTGDDLYGGDEFCDTEISSGQVFTSSTQEMILFTSIKGSSSSSWSAQLTFEDDPGCSSKEITTSAPATAPTPVNLICKRGVEVTRVEKGKTVMFTTPNFPEVYRRKTSCGAILQKQAGSFIINCSSFALEPRHRRRRCKDYLRLNGIKYCGENGPEEVTIDADLLNIKFLANRKRQYAGFTCTATVV